MKKIYVLGALLLALALTACGCASSDFSIAVVLTGGDQGAESEAQPKEPADEEPEMSKTADEEPDAAELEPVTDLHPYDFTVTFAGDVNLAENWNTMEFYNRQENGIYDCIDERLIEKMNNADLMCLNMEFCMSSVGSPMEGKMYTFRADPSRMEILEELGVDLVNLANNHVYDYGTDAFLDMLRILQENGMPYVGAGADEADAQRVFYTELDGRRVAVVSATRAEKYILTPEADKDTPGVFRCYDTERLLEVVREARTQADFVIAYIHWGTEYSETLEEVQTAGARELAEAGADVVLGAHPHCLQGMEYIGDVPVFYSLGNYWFNEKTLDTMLVELRFYGDDEEEHLDARIVPARQEDHVTYLLTDEAEIEDFNAHMIQMSPSAVAIDENEIVRPADDAEDE